MSSDMGHPNYGVIDEAGIVDRPYSEELGVELDQLAN
jgi:hypothetical protein